MTRLLVTVHREPGEWRDRHRPDWRVDPELERAEWHDHHVDVFLEAPFGTTATDLLAERGHWLVAFSGWVTTATDIDVPLTAAQLAGLVEAQGVGVLFDLAGEYLIFALHRPSRRWWLVRDATGIQSGLHAGRGGVVALGTGAGDVATAAALPREPDLGYLTMLLAWGPSPGNDTPLVGLTRLQPGGVLTGSVADTPTTTTWTWWTPPLPDSRPEPTVDELRDVYRRIIRGRIAATGPGARIAVELSGGLDSTLLAALARELVPAERLVAITMVYEGPYATDLPYARLAADALDIELIEAVWRPRTDQEILDECEGGARIPDSSNGMGSHFGVARSAGVGVLLRGIGGDQWTSGWKRMALLELVARRQIRAARAQFGSYPDAREWLAALRSSLRAVVALSTPGRPVLLQRRRQRLSGAAPWTQNGTTEKYGIAERIFDSESYDRVGVTLWRMMLFRDGWEQLANSSMHHHAATSGVAHSLPFWHHPAVATALAIPEERRWRIDDHRALARDLLPSLVPNGIRSRAYKGDFSSLAYQEELGQSLGPPEGWVSTRAGLVAPEEASVALRQGQDGSSDWWPSWRLAAVEWCLRSCDVSL